MISFETILLQNRYAQFIDSLRIRVSGGAGGNGLPRYGGVGGKGGDVVIEATDKANLKTVKENGKMYKAKSGESSASFRIVGMPGQDCIVKVPVGITVVNEKGSEIAHLNQPGDKVVVASGGRGGDRNNNFCGSKGQSQTIKLDLRLIADAGLVGFPNAGKSTLLKAISRAKPKIANYPFTTINPNIGMIEYEDYRKISVADLPGLIDGAHANVGLGHSFLKHIERTKLLVFVIDVNGFRYRPDWPSRTPLDTLLYLNRELELYDDRLLSKPAILVVTKVDDQQHFEEYEKFLQEFENLNKNGMENVPEEMRSNELIKFDEVIPVCAKKAFNVVKLRDTLRSLIELNFEIEREKKGENITYRQILQDEKAKIDSGDKMLI